MAKAIVNINKCEKVKLSLYFINHHSTKWRWVVSFTPLPLYPRGIAPGTHWRGGWVDLRAGLDAVEKRIPLATVGSRTPDSSTVQSVARQCTTFIRGLLISGIFHVLRFRFFKHPARPTPGLPVRRRPWFSLFPCLANGEGGQTVNPPPPPIIKCDDSACSESTEP
jgi:hypothetical protein